MQFEDEHEIVRCYQCDWPMRRGEPFTVVIGECEGCGEIHPVGVIHLEVCTAAMAMGMDRPGTQKRRAGLMGMN